jgi:hypothetical protein
MSLAKYQYAELSQPDTIRLLNIFPQKDDPETLRCKLLELPLRISETLTRPYEALSYVWGSEDSPRSIIITDGTDDRQLKVTNNLHSALLHLRDNDISRIIWVDAVCINQSNNAEKKGQIGLMPAIYSKASRVIVWLGDSKDDGSSALETIRDAAEGPRNFSSTQQPSETSLIQHSENASETELPTPRAVLALLRRPWFRRIWVRSKLCNMISYTAKMQ